MIAMETATYLGPATAMEIEKKRVRVRLADEEVWARIAMPFRPDSGDELLVVRLEGGELYAIGILEGAPRLESDRCITIRAPEVRVEAGKFDVTARRIVEKARDVYRWVSDLFQVKARRMRAVVEEDYHLRAGTANVKATADVNIDGKSINLG